MGASESKWVPLPAAAEQPGVLCVTFSAHCLITLVNQSAADVDAVRRCVLKHWTLGLEWDRAACNTAWSFGLNGSPFERSEDTSSWRMRRMVCDIVQCLHTNGWAVCCVSTLGRHLDKGSLFFRRSPEAAGQGRSVMCVAMCGTDTIQFVNIPPGVFDELRVAAKSWKHGVKFSKVRDDVHLARFSGTPWRAKGNDYLAARMLLHAIFASLSMCAFRFIGAVNVKGTSDMLLFEQADSPFALELCTLALNDERHLKLICPPSGILALIRRLVSSKWDGGIVSEQHWQGNWDFELHGSPWHSKGAEALSARALVLEIVMQMYRQGWDVLASVNTSRKPHDKSSVLFSRRAERLSEAPVVELMCLAPHKDNMLHAINAPKVVFDNLQQVALQQWARAVDEPPSPDTVAVEVLDGVVPTLQFRGKPWKGYNADGNYVHLRHLVCCVLTVLQTQGWSALFSADVTSTWKLIEKGSDFPKDVEAIWFVRNAPTVTSTIDTSEPCFHLIRPPRQRVAKTRVAAFNAGEASDSDEDKVVSKPVKERDWRRSNPPSNAKWTETGGLPAQDSVRRGILRRPASAPSVQRSSSVQPSGWDTLPLHTSALEVWAPTIPAGSSSDANDLAAPANALGSSSATSTSKSQRDRPSSSRRRVKFAGQSPQGTPLEPDSPLHECTLENVEDDFDFVSTRRDAK
jgi:hypothetical protein